MVYIDLFGNVSTSIILPSEIKRELNQSDTFSKQLSTGFAFTNTDWDSVMWGCSLAVIVRILNLSKMW